MADALSKRSEDVDQTKLWVSVTSATHSWLSEVAASYKSDSSLLSIMDELLIKTNNGPPFSLKNGILRYKDQTAIESNTDLRNNILY